MSFILHKQQPIIKDSQDLQHNQRQILCTVKGWMIKDTIA